MFEKKLHSVEKFLKRGAFGLAPPSGNKKFSLQCETGTHAPLLLRLRHQDGKSALKTTPSEAAETDLAKFEDFLEEVIWLFQMYQVLQAMTSRSF